MFKETFISKLAEMAQAEEQAKAQAETTKEAKSALTSHGAALAESLVDAIEAGEVDDSFFETLPKQSRVTQSYLSRGKKVGFALKKGTIQREGRSVLRLYDLIQEQGKADKETKAVQSNANAQVYAAILAACDNDQGEANRIMSDPLNPEYIVHLQTGFAILAEKQAAETAKERAENMGRFVTETKAALAEIAGTEFWPEIMAEFTKLNQEIRKAA